MRRYVKRNPTDYELLKRLKIKKYYIHGQHIYEIFLDNITPENYIGEINYNSNKNYITNVAIHTNYQRKGIGTFIYDMIEKDFGVELVPSNEQSKKAKLFWYDREYKKFEKLKKNPRDEELLKQITIISEEEFPKNKKWLYDIYFNKNKIGTVIYYEDDNYMTNASLDESFHRKGIMSYVYDQIEKDFNIKLKPSRTLSKKGKVFWANRLKKNPMKTRSKTSKRKSSCKCKSPSSLRKCSCSRRKNPLDGKIPTRDFRNLNPDKYYIFHLYGNISQWGKPVLSDPKRFIVESNSERTVHFWEDLLNVYGPFNTSKQAIDAWKKLLNEGYL